MKKTNLVQIFMLIMLLTMSTGLSATTYTVTSITDTGSETGTAGKLSWAITQSNASSGVDDVIEFNLSSGSTVTLSGALPIISDGVTIDGNDDGTLVTVQVATPGTSTYRVFNIDASGKTVNISNMTIKGGDISGASGTDSYGGAIYAGGNTTNLTMSNSIITGSKAKRGGGIGLYNGVELTINNASVSNCIGDYGGGIYIEVYSDGAGTINITNSTINDNTAQLAGGIFLNVGSGVREGTLNIVNSTINGNLATTFNGGGIVAEASGGTAVLNVSNSTIAENSVNGSTTNNTGGGIHCGNANVVVKNSIIANNTAFRGADYFESSCATTDNGYNVIGVSDGYTWTGTGDWTDQDGNGTFDLYDTSDTGTLNLSPTLALNHNPNGTWTLSYTDGSSIGIDDGIGTDPDQRGATVYNGTKDIGAYEWQGSEGTLPVTLSSFTAQFIENTTTLYWTTQSETSNAGWNIYRSQTDMLEQAVQINLEIIPGAGTTSEPTEYGFEDVFPIYLGTTYFYWLESVDYSGLTDSYGPISLLIPEEGEEPGSPEVPGIYGLHQNYPNPFNPNTEISFMMKESCIGQLSIFNIKGQKIKILFSNKSILKDELVTYNWNGKDESGKEVSTGVYYYKLRTSKGDFVRKMILMK